MSSATPIHGKNLQLEFSEILEVYGNKGQDNMNLDELLDLDSRVTSLRDKINAIYDQGKASKQDRAPVRKLEEMHTELASKIDSLLALSSQGDKKRVASDQRAFDQGDRKRVADSERQSDLKSSASVRAAPKAKKDPFIVPTSDPFEALKMIKDRLFEEANNLVSSDELNSFQQMVNRYTTQVNNSKLKINKEVHQVIDKWVRDLQQAVTKRKEFLAPEKLSPEWFMKERDAILGECASLQEKALTGAYFVSFHTFNLLSRINIFTHKLAQWIKDNPGYESASKKWIKIIDDNYFLVDKAFAARSSVQIVKGLESEVTAIEQDWGILTPSKKEQDHALFSIRYTNLKSELENNQALDPKIKRWLQEIGYIENEIATIRDRIGAKRRLAEEEAKVARLGQEDEKTRAEKAKVIAKCTDDLNTITDEFVSYLGDIENPQKSYKTLDEVTNFIGRITTLIPQIRDLDLPKNSTLSKGIPELESMEKQLGKLLKVLKENAPKVGKPRQKKEVSKDEFEDKDHPLAKFNVGILAPFNEKFPRTDEELAKASDSQVAKWKSEIEGILKKLERYYNQYLSEGEDWESAKVKEMVNNLLQKQAKLEDFKEIQAQVKQADKQRIGKPDKKA